jgi:hypothetical protein
MYIWIYGYMLVCMYIYVYIYILIHTLFIYNLPPLLSLANLAAAASLFLRIISANPPPLAGLGLELAGMLPLLFSTGDDVGLNFFNLAAAISAMSPPPPPPPPDEEEEAVSLLISFLIGDEVSFVTAFFNFAPP